MALLLDGTTVLPCHGSPILHCCSLCMERSLPFASSRHLGNDVNVVNRNSLAAITRLLHPLSLSRAPRGCVTAGGASCIRADICDAAAMQLHHS